MPSSPGNQAISSPTNQSPKSKSLSSPQRSSTSKLLKKQKSNERETLLNKKASVIPDLLDSSVDIYTTDISDEFMAIGNSSGIVEVFDPDFDSGHNRLFTLTYGSGHAQSIMAMKFISSNQLLTGDTGGNLCLYDLSSINQATSQNKHQTNPPKMVVEEFDKDILDDIIPVRGILASKRASLTQSKQASRSSIAGSSYTSMIPQKFGITCLDYNNKNSILAIGQDRTIRLYDKKRLARTSISRRQLDKCTNMEDSILEGHSKTPHCCKFIDEDLFVTSGWDDCLKVWDRRCPQLAVVSINGTHVCGPAIDVQPGSDNKVLCVGNWRSSEGLQLWDLRRAGASTKINSEQGVPENLLEMDFGLEVNHNLPNRGHMIYAVKFLNRNTILAGGSGEGPLLAVDVSKKEIIDTLDFKKRGINSISVSSDKILVGGAKGASKVIQV